MALSKVSSCLEGLTMDQMKHLVEPTLCQAMVTFRRRFPERKNDELKVIFLVAPQNNKPEEQKVTLRDSNNSI